MSSKAYQPFLNQHRLKRRSPSNLLQALPVCCSAAPPTHRVLELQAAPHHPQPAPCDRILLSTRCLCAAGGSQHEAISPWNTEPLTPGHGHDGHGALAHHRHHRINLFETPHFSFLSRCNNTFSAFTISMLAFGLLSCSYFLLFVQQKAFLKGCLCCSFLGMLQNTCQNEVL